SASAKVICFIEKLGDWCPEILPNQEVFFRISLEELGETIKKINPDNIRNSIRSLPDNLIDALMSEAEKAAKDWFKRNVTDQIMPNLPVPELPRLGQFRLPKL
ncbi:hypothetical protein YA0868_21875, partial [Pseudomonas syringae]